MQNPLRKYKEQNPDLDWQAISDKTGLSIQTLISTMAKEQDRIGGVTIATSERIKRSLGIDLGEFYIIK